MLAHEIIFDLGKGAITEEKAAAELDRLADRAAQSDANLFDSSPLYIDKGADRRAIAELLHTAAERIRERSNRK